MDLFQKAMLDDAFEEQNPPDDAGSDVAEARVNNQPVSQLSVELYS